MNTKNILIGIGSFIALFVVLFFAYKLTNSAAPPPDYSQVNKIKETDHVKWKPDSQNILIEYSDLQCPACQSFYAFFKDLEKTATPNAALVFRHFPLYQIHPNAFAAAEAAEAAGQQDKFWEMESALYEKQTEWSGLANPNDYFLQLATNLNLDLAQFKKDVSSQVVKDRVQADATEAESIGVNATPTFILNGSKVNVNTMEEFKQLLLSL
jgi:protein-disulfide isomerase